MRSICVYCGSGPGNDPIFTEAAHDLGEIFARERIRGVFGGGSLGLMGAFSTGIRSHGGKLVAVIPQSLFEKEQPIVPINNDDPDASYRLIVAADMYDRKRNFRLHSDAFVALPGGAGTRDEIWEELTGIQIGHHKKPLVLVNIMNRFQHIIADIAQMREDGFIRPGLEFDGLFAVVASVAYVLPALRRMTGDNSSVVQLHQAG